MKIKIIDRNIDHVINKNYYLCKINLIELHDFMKTQFEEKDFNKFNNDYEEELKKKEIDEEELRKEYEKEHVLMKNDSFEKYKKSKIENINYFFNSDKNKQIEEEKKLLMIYNTATENNFISLWSHNMLIKNDIIEFQNKVYLLDGFRRLLFDLNYFEKNKNKDVYVKIYDEETNDQDIMKLMLHLNLWKIPQGLSTMMDRGWRFFIYNRTKTFFNIGDFARYSKGNVYSSKNYYGQIEKMVTNKKFYDDLKQIEIMNQFTKDNKEDINLKRLFFFNNRFLENLGKLRYNEYYEQINYLDFAKFLRININELRRINKMSVSGWTERPIKKLSEDFFDKIKEPNGLEYIREFDLSTIKYDEVMRDEYLEQLDEKIKSELGVKPGKYRDYVVIKNRTHKHKNNKLYRQIHGYQGEVLVRIYLISKEYYLFKRGNYYIIDKVENELLLSHGQRELRTGDYYNKKEAIIKFNELTGAKIEKLNPKETEYIIEGEIYK